MKIHDYQVFTVSNHSRVLLRIHELEKEASVRKKKKKKKYIYIYIYIKQTDISVPRNMAVHKTRKDAFRCSDNSLRGVLSIDF